MSQDQIFGKLQEYGAYLITNDGSVVMEEPLFDLSLSEHREIMNTVARSQDEALRVGFAATVTKQMSSSFRKLTESEKCELRDAFFGYATTITDERELPTVLETISGLWMKFGGNWSGLVDFILDSEENILLKANIITTCPFLRDEAFLKAYGENLVPVLVKLLTGYPELDVPRISIVMLLATCQPTLTQEIMDIAWNIVLSIDNERERNNTAIPAIFAFSSIHGYERIQPAPVKAMADVFADSASDLDARLAAITPLIPFFAFLDSETFHMILPSMVEVLTINFYEARVLIDMLSEADLETMSEATVNGIFRHLSSEMKTPERKEAALALLGPFIEMVIRENPEALEPISQDILCHLRDGGFRTVVGCMTLRYLADFLEKENKELFHELLPWVVADDENVMIEAYKTMKKLMTTHMYSTDENEKDLLSLYPSFAPSEFMRFIRLIEVLLEHADDPGIAFAEPIYEFALPLTSAERTMRDNAVGLALCRQLLLLASEYVEDHVVDLIAVATNILSSNESEFFPPAIEILGDIVDIFKQDKDLRESVLSLMPRMQEIMERKVPIENKQFSQAANGIAHIVSICDLRDVAPDICQMALTFINCADESEEEVYSLQILGSSLLNTLSNTLIPATAKELFNELSQFVVTATDPDVVSNILQALTGLLKKYGTKIDFAHANELADKLMNGKTASIKKVMSMDEESDSGVFDYMKQFVKKFKQNTIGHVHSLMSVFPSVSTFIIPSVAIPIAKALKIRILSNDSVSEFFVTLQNMMDENEDDLQVLAEIFSLVLDIKRNYLEVIEPEIPILIQRLEQIFDVYDAEDEPELAQLLSLLLLELYASSKDGRNVTPDILIGIVDSLPFPAESCDLQFMLQAVTDLTKPDWAQRMDIIQSIARMLGRVLLMKKTEIDEYQVEPYVLTRAKNCLKILCTANKEIESCVRSSVCNSKAKQSALNAILK